MMSPFLDTSFTLLLMAAIASVGILISTSEILYLSFKGFYKHEGILGWRMIKLYQYTFKRLFGVLDPFMSLESVVIIGSIRFLAALAIIVGILLTHTIYVIPVLILFLSTIYFNFRHPYGIDGQDQLQSILVFALFFAIVYPATELSKEFVLFFVGAQAVLAYNASGLAKFFSIHWRKENVALKIFSTEAFGRKLLANLLTKHPILSKNIGTFVLAVFLSVWLVLLLPFPYSLIPLVALMSFHFSVALIMRLNLFTWFFLASYPALLFLSAHLQLLLHS